MCNQNEGIDLPRPDNGIGLPVGKTSNATASISDCSVCVQSLAYPSRVDLLEKSIPAGDWKSLCFSEATAMPIRPDPGHESHHRQRNPSNHGDDYVAISQANHSCGVPPSICHCAR